MKISRLDQIIENNVSYSVTKRLDEQKVHLLQDISETLAMIYDKLCDVENSPRVEMKIAPVTTLVPVEALTYGANMYVEYFGFAEGDMVDFVRYDTEELIDVKNNEKKSDLYAVLNITSASHAKEVRLNLKEYGYKWRCWSAHPTDEERKKEKWL